MTFALPMRTAPAATGWWASRRTRRHATADAPPNKPARVELTWANRRPGSAGFARWAGSVAHRIDARGLDATASEVTALVALARPLGAAPIAVEVLADPAQPEATRLEAFANVVAVLVGLDAHSVAARSPDAGGHI